MQIRDDRAFLGISATDQIDDILSCRMAMLGLDLGAIESRDRDAITAIRQCCGSCEDREVCIVDLKRDPNSPVWVTYCPNATAFYSLAKEWW